MKATLNILVAFFVLLALQSASAATMIQTNPASVSFGTIQAGQAASRQLAVKNTSNKQLKFTFSVTSPFTVAPSSQTVGAGQTVNILIALPATVSIGKYTSTLTILAFDGTPRAADGLHVAVTAAVQGGLDLIVSSVQLASQTAAGENRDVRIKITLQSSGADNVIARTTGFLKVGTGGEAQFYDNIPDTYTLTGFSKEVQAIVPGNQNSITVRFVADSDTKVVETNETNNQKTVTITLPPLQ